MNNEDLIRRLSFENYIWITFIIVSIIDIYGDELVKRSVNENDETLENKAQNLFLGVSLISILVYIYFFYRNYSDYKNSCSKCNKIRLFGSSLILIGTFCLLYFQLYNKKIELPSNV